MGSAFWVRKALCGALLWSHIVLSLPVKVPATFDAANQTEIQWFGLHVVLSRARVQVSGTLHDMSGSSWVNGRVASQQQYSTA